MDENKVKENIFKAYDIRGVYPKEINEYFASVLAEAFVDFLSKKGRRKGRKIKVVVGRDSRNSSLTLSLALKNGIIAKGVDVIDIGMVTTPMFYFSVWKYNFDGGIMVTASHNPPEFNGFKLVGENAVPIGEESGLKKIKKLVLTENTGKKNIPKGKVHKKSVLKEYLKDNFSKTGDISNVSRLKIAIDTGNSVAGILISGLKQYLPCKIYSLFSKIDGNFPNHLPDPLKDKNIKSLKEFVKEKRLDLGVAFDGDGDRIVFIDEKGKAISSSFIICLMAMIILRNNPGAKILYDVRSSNAIRDIVIENKGKPIISRVGHAFIKARMKKDNIIFGGELSGHFYSKSNNFCESPLFVLVNVLKEISRQGKPISKIILPFKRYFHSGEINFKVSDKKAKIEALSKIYKKGKILIIDGLRVDFKDWWFNVRPSNTENLLRLVVEAKTKELMKEKVKEIGKIIKSP